MAEQKKGPAQQTQGGADHAHKPKNDKPHGGAKVIDLHGGCLAEGCKEKSKKANFCMEHFDWFKEGLITKEGRKPSDFDKKFFAYTARKNKQKVA